MREGLSNKFKNQAHAMMTGRTKKTPSPTKLYNLLSSLLFPLVSWYSQLRSSFRGIISHEPDKVTASVACKGELGLSCTEQQNI